MKRTVLFVLLSAMAFGGIQLDAQGPTRKFANLQVFPPDASQDVVMAAMKNFTLALGVRCPFCHVGEEGMPLEKFDFASDAKPEKLTARGMMRLTAEINGRITKAMPDAPAKGFQVTCWTCHRGSNHPQHSPDAPKPPGR
jgi:photosynthetic reaction center cytochrome c subunit